MSFIEKFNQNNPRFLEKLLKKHPSLSQREILLCMYLKLNFSSKDISKKMKVSSGTIDTYRYNIRKKVGLKRKESLIGALNTL